MLEKIPEWFGTAVLGAVFAVLGFLAKWLWDWRVTVSKERAETLGRLQKMKSLLDASNAIYEIQQRPLKELMGHLKSNHPDLFRPDGGYEENIAVCYRAMVEKEKELHGIVRTYTENSMKTLNEAMLAWLQADTVFKSGLAPVLRASELAEQLFALEIHLLLWHAKYKVWIPDHPEHALVYMEDENQHGLGFPSGADEAVKAAVSELRAKWK
jgi:hypothetical protein